MRGLDISTLFSAQIVSTKNPSQHMHEAIFYKMALAFEITKDKVVE